MLTTLTRAKENSIQLQKLPAGSPVIIYRTRSKTWKGKCPLSNIDNETVCLQLDRRRKIFRSTTVRPQIDSLLNDPITTGTNNKYFGATNTVKGEGIYDVKTPRAKEVEGLLKSGTLKPGIIGYITPATRIFGPRFVDEVKRMEVGTIHKLRLVSQSYRTRRQRKIY